MILPPVQQSLSGGRGDAARGLRDVDFGAVLVHRTLPAGRSLVPLFYDLNGLEAELTPVSLAPAAGRDPP